MAKTTDTVPPIRDTIVSRPVQSRDVPSHRDDLEQRFEDIARLVSDWVWEVDADLRLTFISHRVFEVLGVHPAKLLGSMITDLGSFIVSSGETPEPDWRLPFQDRPMVARDASGQSHELLVSGLPVFNAATGAFAGLRGTVRDISIARRAEAELKRQQSLFQAVFRDSPDGLALVDLRGTILMINLALKRIFGSAAEELLSRRAGELFADPEDWVRFRRAHRRRRPNRLPRPFQARLRLGDGGTFPGEVMASKIGGEDGEAVANLLVFRDVSSREGTERALRESEERFRNLVEGTSHGIVISANGRPLFANHAFATMFGYESVSEIYGMDNLDPLYAPHERPRIRAYRKSRTEGKQAPDQVELQGVRRDGSFIWLEALLREVQWQGHRALQATLVDISGRKRTSEALRDSEARFRGIFESSATGMALVSPLGHFRLVNRALASMFGYTQTELLSRRSLQFIHPDDRREHQGQWARLLDSEIDSYHVEERYLRKDGHVCWGVTSMAAIRNDRGHAMYAICQVHDVTERRAAEQRLKESESRVRAIIDNSPAAICLKDTEGRFVVAGRQFETWHRLAPGAALGRTVHDVCAPPVADILTADDRSVLTAGVGMQREMDVTLPDGRPRTLLTMRFLLIRDTPPVGMYVLNMFCMRGSRLWGSRLHRACVV